MSAIVVAPERVLEIISEVSAIPSARIRWHGSIFGELGVDSLGAFAIMVELRRAFGTHPPDTEEEYRALDTPAKLFEYARSYAIPHPVPADEHVALPGPAGSQPVSNLLPIDPPFRFVDAILQVGPHTIVTEFTFLPTHPIMRAHFRGGPAVVPGAILTEQVGQSAWILARLSDRLGTDDRLVLGRTYASFQQPAPIGRALQARVEMELERPAQGLLAFLGTISERQMVVARVSGIAKLHRADEPIKATEP